MQPEDLPLLNTLSEPAVAPDGSWAIVAVTHPDLDADAYVGQLWRIDLTGQQPPRRLTRGFADTQPRVSPGGGLVGFLRAGAGERPQLHVIPVDGGEAAPVTDAKLGVSAFEFSPDGRQLAFVARVPDDGRYGTLDGVDADAEDARRIDTLTMRGNGVGWTNDRRHHVFVVDVPDPFAAPPVTPVGRAARGRTPEELRALRVPHAIQVTQGDADYTEPVYTPDGRGILVTSALQDDRDRTLVTHLYRLSRHTGPQLVETPVSASGACFSGDGQTLFFLGSDLGPSGRDFVGRLTGVYAMPARGGVARRLTDDLLIEGPLRAIDGDAVLARADVRGRHALVRVSASGRVDEWTGDFSVLGAASAGRRGVVATASDPGTPGEVALLSERGEEWLTDFGGPLREASERIRPVELTAHAPDGHPVHGWVLVPGDEGPHPVVLVIHGGPHAAYGPDFFDEFQVLAEAGYAVVACNPRGAAGYGEEHARAIQGDFGNLDAADVLAFLDHALEVTDGLASDQLGIMGGSYGGYLTAWIIAHDHRFSGAIVERGYLDPASFVGASDIGWYFVEQYNGTDRARLDAQSPTLLTDQVRTPTLVIHSEQDLRCPIGQALRYYTQLKLAGVDAVLLVFPGENHELSRSGRPQHRLQRYRAILSFWRRHLPRR